MKKLYDLIGELPDELTEEGTTGRDLINNIIYQSVNESTLGYLGIDQYGNHYILKGKHPRKELLEKLGAINASKMYCDRKNGSPKHIGYIIKGYRITLYRVSEWVGN